MKRLFTTCTALLLALCLHEANAQIGINTMNPDPNAVLDIRSKDKGVKLPSFKDLIILGTPPDSGYLIYYSPNKKFKYWNGTYWESVNPLKADASENVTAPNNLNVTGTATANDFVGYGTIPIGGIIMWSGTGEPGDGWALCDGRTKNGYTTPNLSGRFIVGYNASNPDYNQPGNLSTKSSTQGNMGGHDTLTLTNDNLPAHSHGAGTLITEKSGTHSHLYQGYYAVDDGGGEHVKSNKKEPNDPYDYGGEPAGEHTHGIIGSTDTTGGIYTFESYPNPELLNPIEKCFPYIIKISGMSYYADKDNMGGNNSGDEYYYYAEPDPSYSGPYYKYFICIKNTTSNTTYRTPEFFISNYSNSFVIDGIIITDNPSYVPETPYINPLHIEGKKKDEIIVHNRKWAVQPIDKRPAYYVLAFIMRIK